MKKITIEDNKYEVGSGIGAWLKSYEYNVVKGDVRSFNGVLLKAYMVCPRTKFFVIELPSEIWWNPVDEDFNTYENLRTWIDKL